MDPIQKQINKSEVPQDPAKAAAYADSLLHMMQMQEDVKKSQVPKKRLLSTKKLVFIIVSIVLTVLSLLWTPSLFKSDKNADSTDKAQQFIDNAAGLKDPGQ